MDDSPPQSADSSLIERFVEAGMNDIAARIMAAALRLFAEKGYAGTTVREIVSEADVTNPMLYYYFDSKEGVFGALIEALFDSMVEPVEQAVEQGATLRGQLRQIGRAYFEGCLTSPEVVQFVYSALFGPGRSCPEFEVPEGHVVVRTLIEETIADAIERGEFEPQPGFDPELLTERFMGLVDNHLMGALSLYAHGRGYIESRQTVEDYLADEALEQMLDFFFRGAGRFNEESR